jgi:hypothetical protein
MGSTSGILVSQLYPIRVEGHRLDTLEGNLVLCLSLIERKHNQLDRRDFADHSLFSLLGFTIC